MAYLLGHAGALRLQSQEFTHSQQLCPRNSIKKPKFSALVHFCPCKKCVHKITFGTDAFCPSTKCVHKINVGTGAHLSLNKVCTKNHLTFLCAHGLVPAKLYTSFYHTLSRSIKAQYCSRTQTPGQGRWRKQGSRPAPYPSTPGGSSLGP